MNLPDDLLADTWIATAWLLFVPCLLWIMRQAPWRRLADTAHLNVWLGAIVALTLLWSLKAGIRPGLSLHLLGVSVMVLAFGFHLACIGLCVVLAGVTVNGDAGWSGYAANALLMVGVGAVTAQLVLRFNERFLPHQLFVYIFANGFFGAALSVVAVGLAASSLFVVAGVYPAGYLAGEFLPYVLLLAFSEAWLSGMVVTLLVIYRPDWVVSFDDSRYLGG